MLISGLAHSRVIPRLAAIGLVFACLAFTTGCPEQSLNGLEEGGSDPDMVYEARLVGTWPFVSEKCISTLTISAHEKVYRLEHVDCENKKTTSYEGHLFKLDQHYFLDWTAPSDKVCDLCIAIHLIYLVQFEKDSISLAPLDYDWVKEAVQNKSVNLTTLPDDPGTITSPSKELKAFCRKYADNKEVFKHDPDWVLPRQIERGPS